MALTLNEQLEVIRSGQEVGSYKLSDLIVQGTISKCSEFMSGAKVVDIGTNALAYSYRTKVISACRRIITMNSASSAGGISKDIISLFIAHISLGVITKIQIDAVNGSTLTSFMDSNILPVIEQLAGVLPEEKTDYDGL